MPEFISDTIQIHAAAFDKASGEYKFLVLRRSEKLDVYPLLWQVITGNMEPGETAVRSAVREFTEETGVRPEKIWTLPLLAEYFDPYTDMINMSPVFGTIIDINSKIRLSTEHCDYKWLNFEECLEILPLPSHKKGTKIFRDSVLDKEDKSLFLFTGELT